MLSVKLECDTSYRATSVPHSAVLIGCWVMDIQKMTSFHKAAEESQEKRDDSISGDTEACMQAQTWTISQSKDLNLVFTASEYM